MFVALSSYFSCSSDDVIAEDFRGTGNLWCDISSDVHTTDAPVKLFRGIKAAAKNKLLLLTN